MNKPIENYIALRFRSDDGIHRKGEIQYITDCKLYIGQTQECSLKLPTHPDYADTCYAVIVRNDNGIGWRIVRQESEAEIRVNGMPLELIQYLNDGDKLSFDHTVVVFSEEQGTIPVEKYIYSQSNKGIWGVMSIIVLAIAAILFYLIQKDKDDYALFRSELASIYRIEADTLLVYNSCSDTIDVVALPCADVGTGFVTNDGYFVTARHCVEFWLAHEHELKQHFQDIESEVLRRVIEAEMDSAFQIVAKLRIVGKDGIPHYYTSKDFLMDKSRDHIYEYGDFESTFFWRSIVSRYESRDAELGDVALMRWEHDEGQIALANPGEMKNLQGNAELKVFGYPQDNNRQESKLTFAHGQIFHSPKTDKDCFICDQSFDHGFSGSPVFISTNANTHKAVVGIVSRSDENHTLIVPVSAIYQLINQRKDQ